MKGHTECIEGVLSFNTFMIIYTAAFYTDIGEKTAGNLMSVQVVHTVVFQHLVCKLSVAVI